MQRDWGGGVCCLLEVPEGCSSQVNVLQCPLKASILMWVIRWKSVPLGYCSGKEELYL